MTKGICVYDTPTYIITIFFLFLQTNDIILASHIQCQVRWLCMHLNYLPKLVFVYD